MSKIKCLKIKKKKKRRKRKRNCQATVPLLKPSCAKEKVIPVCTGLHSDTYGILFRVGQCLRNLRWDSPARWVL